MIFKDQNQKLKVARVLILAQLIFIVTNLIVFYQTKFQLVSNLISEAVIIEIVEPYIMMSIILSISVMVSFVLYCREKLIAAIGISFLVLTGQMIVQYYVER
ncbi:hypothetical protein Solca_3577 [Solitalea canadensis DSM 3403]|uniref:Uncharacterized protein n=1 Tax=Solitalea canadensis (strain ATCC 29591 / DSM 3403 / JCM 21819 / LMG 8368 / NBRC 15130 / NCIMB 12057 / USAM 9D) TaxID=929556 RepID=H8KSN0_SOLCM|nr:hypothetical protein Solca_3577 [Solitalea canadensis DSM 3403]